MFDVSRKNLHSDGPEDGLIQLCVVGSLSGDLYLNLRAVFFLLQSHKTFNASTTECINFLLRLSALRFVVKVLVFTAKF